MLRGVPSHFRIPSLSCSSSSQTRLIRWSHCLQWINCEDLNEGAWFGQLIANLIGRQWNAQFYVGIRWFLLFDIYVFKYFLSTHPLFFFYGITFDVCSFFAPPLGLLSSFLFDKSPFGFGLTARFLGNYQEDLRVPRRYKMSYKLPFLAFPIYNLFERLPCYSEPNIWLQHMTPSPGPAQIG